MNADTKSDYDYYMTGEATSFPLAIPLQSPEGAIENFTLGCPDCGKECADMRHIQEGSTEFDQFQFMALCYDCKVISHAFIRILKDGRTYSRTFTDDNWKDITAKDGKTLRTPAAPAITMPAAFEDFLNGLGVTTVH